ncbi:aldehyde dehydrogenase family protein [Actinocrispum wychmicini]|uniref:Betaine-aldehyde dehydrogenase n=1 Tax=Actinocrispum wychmicini TaxID=1213861 RepID=A0A4R2JNX3_9PSEU|nr:aldehyde dehydrogenase family protein [Actinocrispum wychmicini]TCO61064.1 betaine-aldehyde dehydrogenase [Actinocrispum wychmicini]
MATRVTPLTTEVFVAGEWRAGQGGTIVDVSPATERPLADIAVAGPRDVDDAVAAARSQVDGEWGRMPVGDRIWFLEHLVDLVERDASLLTRLAALDTGTPIARLSAMDNPVVLRHPRAGTRREVVGAVHGSAAPALVTVRRIAPALAAGSAVVVQPPMDAPLPALHLAWLVEEAGLPPGVVNVVPSVDRLGHPGIDRVEEIAAAPAPIVHSAAPGELFTHGVLVHRSCRADVLDELVAAADAQVLGDPLDPRTTMGPLINATQREEVLNYVAEARKQGARLVTGGGRPDRPGYFVEPTVLACERCR